MAEDEQSEMQAFVKDQMPELLRELDALVNDESLTPEERLFVERDLPELLRCVEIMGFFDEAGLPAGIRSKLEQQLIKDQVPSMEACEIILEAKAKWLLSS